MATPSWAPELCAGRATRTSDEDPLKTIDERYLRTCAGAPGVLLERVRQLDAVDKAVVQEAGVFLVNRHEKSVGLVRDRELSVGLQRD